MRLTQQGSSFSPRRPKTSPGMGRDDGPAVRAAELRAAKLSAPDAAADHGEPDDEGSAAQHVQQWKVVEQCTVRVGPDKDSATVGIGHYPKGALLTSGTSMANHCRSESRVAPFDSQSSMLLPLRHASQ